MWWFRPLFRMWPLFKGFLGDRHGGVVLDSSRNDRLLAMAAKKTIVVVEKLAEPDDVIPGRHGVYLAPIHVDAVVHAPNGAHPTACLDHYPMDEGHLFGYMEAAKDETAFQEYLDKYITGPADHPQYLNVVGG
jgi:glutaconate CoA-transferase subunit A